MERLDGQTRESQEGLASVLELLDRVWRMHPEAHAGDILACALAAQVGHLTQLPVGGGWMMRFLRDLPTFIPADAPIPPAPSTAVQEDVEDALSLRFRANGRSGDAVYRDAADICSAALRCITPGTVCRVAIRAYQQA